MNQRIPPVTENEATMKHEQVATPDVPIDRGTYEQIERAHV